MKRLEEIIRNSKELFNSEEPSVNHFNKFLGKLDVRQTNIKRERLIRRFTYAASVAAVILLVLSIALLRDTPPAENQVTEFISTEIQEIDTYFGSIVDSNIQNLNSALKKCPQHKKNLQTCFRELDRSFEAIKNDLKENPGDERVISALVYHYQLKLEIIEQAIYHTNEKCI